MIPRFIERDQIIEDINIITLYVKEVGRLVPNPCKVTYLITNKHIINNVNIIV